MLFSSDYIVFFRRSHAVLWCLFLVIFVGLPSGAYAGERAKSRFHALCVGLRYPDTGRQLRFTTSDVRAVAEALTISSGYDALSSDIVWLVDDDPRQPKPTPDEVRRRLGRMVADTGPEDRLVFYFSGHGDKDSNNRSFLICHAEGGGDAGNLYISEIRDILDQSPARDKLLIIDACHSGGKSASNGLAPSSLAQSLAGAGKAAGRDTVAWLVSSDVSEQSWEDDESKQGLFTRFFLEAVGSGSSEADVNFDGKLSVPELHHYISENISYYIRKRKNDKDRDWFSRRQSPRMGIGGTISLNGEELAKTAIFYCTPDSSPSPARSPAELSIGQPAVRHAPQMALNLHLASSSPNLRTYSSPSARPLTAPAQTPSAKPPSSPATRYDPSMTLGQCRGFAEKGDAAAQNRLGEAYGYRGKPFSREEMVMFDPAQAVRWFRLAADQGHAKAQYNLGTMYEVGDGVSKDYSEAMRWYRLAADQGYAEAQYTVGIRSTPSNDARGDAKDYSEALRWLRLAADQGHADGQYSLGHLYETGKGVRKDVDEAIRLYRLAAAQEAGVFAEGGGGALLAKSRLKELGIK